MPLNNASLGPFRLYVVIIITHYSLLITHYSFLISNYSLIIVFIRVGGLEEHHSLVGL